jgi:hypothetical protein
MPDNGGGDILWQVYEDGAGSSSLCNADGGGDAAWEIGKIADQNVPLRASARQADDVRFLECVGPERAGRDLS